MSMVNYAQVVESRWNGHETRLLGGLGVFPLRCTSPTPIEGPAPYATLELTRKNECCDAEEDIVDEALFLFKALVLVPKIRVDKAGDRVLLVLVGFLHECLRSIQTCCRAEAGQTLTLQRYSHARRLARADQPGLAHTLCWSAAPEERDDVEAYVSQLFAEASARLIEKVFTSSSPDALGSKWWLLFGRRPFLS